MYDTVTNQSSVSRKKTPILKGYALLTFRGVLSITRHVIDNTAVQNGAYDNVPILNLLDPNNVSTIYRNNELGVRDKSVRDLFFIKRK